MNFKCQEQTHQCTADAMYRVWYYSCGGLYGYRCTEHLAEDIKNSSPSNRDSVSQIEFLFKDEVRAALVAVGQDPDLTFQSYSKAALSAKEYKELFENVWDTEPCPKTVVATVSGKPTGHFLACRFKMGHRGECKPIGFDDVINEEGPALLDNG